MSDSRFAAVSDVGLDLSMHRYTLAVLCLYGTSHEVMSACDGKTQF